ncbi:MAG TPA: VOC family protein [Acidimicrobiia bacterium]|jgi:catechol 2,3-dioxygenase-like lactoylglutathione lyase family enzyme
MPDPLDRLRLPVVAVEPRPEFAAALRRRLEGDVASDDSVVVRPTATVRYFVDDLDLAVAFYRDELDFDVEMQPSPAFAMLYRGELRLLLSTPAGHVLPDGAVPEPGGWNRMSLRVADLARTVEDLRRRGVRFRNEIVSSVGVHQILLQDPAGNLVELFEPTDGYHERT